METFRKYSASELSGFSKEEIIREYLALQDRFIEQLNIEKEKDRLIRVLNENASLSRAEKFGRSSEKMECLSGETTGQKEEEPGSTPPGTGDEVIGEEEEPAKGAEGEKQKGQPKRGKGCMEKLKKELPVKDVHIRLTREELEKRLGTDKWCELPEQCSDIIRYIPAQCYIERQHIHIYSGGGKIVRAGKADKMAPQSMMSESLLAGIMHNKFVLGMPGYRVVQELARLGLPLTKQMSYSWVIRAGFEYFEPFIMRMTQLMFKTGHLQADETPVLVKNNSRGSGMECRFWVFRTSQLHDGAPVIIFHFATGRGADVLRDFCKNYTGTITCDGYAAYQTFGNENPETVTISGCLTHCRRYYANVLKSMREFKKLTAAEKETIPAYAALCKLKEVFKKEKQLADLTPEDRRVRRQKEIRPLMKDFFDWADSFGEDDFDKGGLMMKALTYTRNQRKYLEQFLEDGAVPIHNSASEQSIIPLCIGRNNWKIIDTEDGAVAASYCYSIAETAKANGANPYYYFKYLLEQLPLILKAHPVTSGSDDLSYLDGLMPWADGCREYERIEKRKNTNLIQPVQSG